MKRTGRCPCRTRSSHVLGLVEQFAQSMPTVVSAEVTPDEWDAFVSSHPHGTADHLYGWRAVFEGVLRHRTMYYVARRGSAIVGVLPLVFVHSRLFGKSAISLPFLNDGGTLASDDSVREALLEEAVRGARDFGASHVELRHRERQFPALPVRQHKLGMTRALPASADALWSDVDRKIRNQVRKAQKEGLAIEIGGAELVSAFYQVFAENMRDLGTPVYPKALFAETLKQFGDRARVTVVRHQGRVAAGAVTIRFGQTVVNPWASSLRALRHLCPNMLLYWALLEDAVKHGAQMFDFGRSSPGGGTHQFKLQWGASETPLHWEYVLLSRQEPPNQGPSNPRFQQVIRAWQRLPLPVANLIGPRIARHLP